MATTTQRPSVHRSSLAGAAAAPTVGLRTWLVDSADHGDVYAPDCPSRGVLDHVTTRWGVLVLVGLLGGRLRFSELRRMIGGVSDKMLSQTLKVLHADGFVGRESFLEVPVRVEYQLTSMGEQLALRLVGLTDWIEDHIPDVQAARAAAADD